MQAYKKEELGQRLPQLYVGWEGWKLADSVPQELPVSPALDANRPARTLQGILFFGNAALQKEGFVAFHPDMASQ